MRQIQSLLLFIVAFGTKAHAQPTIPTRFDSSEPPFAQISYTADNTQINITAINAPPAKWRSKKIDRYVDWVDTNPEAGIPQRTIYYELGDGSFSTHPTVNCNRSTHFAGPLLTMVSGIYQTPPKQRKQQLQRLWPSESASDGNFNYTDNANPLVAAGSHAAISGSSDWIVPDLDAVFIISLKEVILKGNATSQMAFTFDTNIFNAIMAPDQSADYVGTETSVKRIRYYNPFFSYDSLSYNGAMQTIYYRINSSIQADIEKNIFFELKAKENILDLNQLETTISVSSEGETVERAFQLVKVGDPNYLYVQSPRCFNSGKSEENSDIVYDLYFENHGNAPLDIMQIEMELPRNINVTSDIIDGIKLRLGTFKRNYITVLSLSQLADSFIITKSFDHNLITLKIAGVNNKSILSIYDRTRPRDMSGDLMVTIPKNKVRGMIADMKNNKQDIRFVMAQGKVKYKELCWIPTNPAILKNCSLTPSDKDSLSRFNYPVLNTTCEGTTSH